MNFQEGAAEQKSHTGENNVEKESEDVCIKELEK